MIQAVDGRLTQKQVDAIDRCCSMYYVINGSIYNIAQSSMIDAYEVLRHDKRFRHQIKQDVLFALRAYEQWDSRMRETLGDRYLLWLDLSDSIAEIIRMDVRRLLWSFDAHLMRNKVEEHRFLATLQTSVTMIDLARETTELDFDRFKKKCGVDIRPLFKGGMFDDVSFRWKRAMDPFLKTEDIQPDIDFNDSKDCVLALRVLTMKLSDPKTYNQAGKDALPANANICRKYDKSYDKNIAEIEKNEQK